jgi:hypothetical protein
MRGDGSLARGVAMAVIGDENRAADFPIEDGWYMAKVLDFPGAVSQGRTLKSARRQLDIPPPDEK